MAAPQAKITSEKRFSDLWERSLDLRPDVVDADGNRYEIIFPGLRNQGPGPDFTGAVLRRGGREFGGDVELHLDQSGWRAHGHHADPAYDGVVLQVVLRLARNANRRPGPPTAIASFPSEPPPPRRAPDMTAAELEALGVERFKAKGAGFLLEMDAGIAPDQAMYQGMMEAMGYARNRKPFLSLSKTVPVSLFSRLRDEPGGVAKFGVFAALAAGGDMLERVEPGERMQIRRVARRLGVRRRLSARDWSMFRVRPSNSPVSRMRSMASIVVRGLRDGLAASQLAEFERGGAKALAEATRDVPGLGRGFALTMVSNVVLPCLYALRSGDGEQAERVISEFREMPSPPGDAVTRGIASALGARVSPANAAQHSGLHALAKSASWSRGGYSGLSTGSQF